LVCDIIKIKFSIFYFLFIKQSFMNKMGNQSGKKIVIFFSMLALVGFIPVVANAGALLDINAGLTSAASTINGTYALVSKLCLAIGAIVGLAGGIRVYVKWNNGDHEIQKEIIGWGGACVFLLLTGTVLTVFFT
jgi:hypothetical protein